MKSQSKFTESWHGPGGPSVPAVPAIICTSHQSPAHRWQGPIWSGARQRGTDHLSKCRHTFCCSSLSSTLCPLSANSSWSQNTQREHWDWHWHDLMKKLCSDFQPNLDRELVRDVAPIQVASYLSTPVSYVTSNKANSFALEFDQGYHVNIQCWVTSNAKVCSTLLDTVPCVALPPKMLQDGEMKRCWLWLVAL